MNMQEEVKNTLTKLRGITNCEPMKKQRFFAVLILFLAFTACTEEIETSTASTEEIETRSNFKECRFGLACETSKIEGTVFTEGLCEVLIEAEENEVSKLCANSRADWMQQLETDSVSWYTNLWLYSLSKRDGKRLYQLKPEDWYGHRRKADIEYWSEFLEKNNICEEF
jgi:hypothetical protein